MDNGNNSYQTVLSKAYVISCISEMTIFCILPMTIIICIPMLIFSLPWHPLLLAMVLVLVLSVCVCWCRRFTKVFSLKCNHYEVTTQEYTDEMNHRTAVAEATQDSDLLYSIRSFIQGINMVHSNKGDPTGTLSNATTQTVMGSDNEFEYEYDPPAYESLISPGGNRANSNNCNNVTNNNNTKDNDKYVTVTPSIRPLRVDHVTEGQVIAAMTTPPCDNNNSTYTGSAPQRRENTPPPTDEDVTYYLPTLQSRV